MKRYILTGTPGSGKTSLIEALRTQGYATVNEAATDVIADEQTKGHQAPWQSPRFIDQIIEVQHARQLSTAHPSVAVQFYDRSPFCTYALAQYLEFEISSTLQNEIERIQSQTIYEKQVFFIQHLGFITHTDARTISLEEALRFETFHRETYAAFGYTCYEIPMASIEERVTMIVKAV
jgi:predicted ATPase